MLRLRMKRGSWIFDDARQLGSNLDFALRMNQPNALEQLEALILEALEPINDEITVGDIETAVSDDERSINVTIKYERVAPQEQSDTPILENQFLVLTLPIVS
jgi:hypothetical protein